VPPADRVDRDHAGADVGAGVRAGDGHRRPVAAAAAGVHAAAAARGAGHGPRRGRAYGTGGDVGVDVGPAGAVFGVGGGGLAGRTKGAKGRGAEGTATWFIAAILCCAAGIVLGLMWDISWHMSVGRDTFWSPPHMLEYLSASVAGILCGGVVLRTTFGGPSE